MTKLVTSTAMIACIVVFTKVASAQNSFYEGKPSRIIAGFSPGGGCDALRADDFAAHAIYISLVIRRLSSTI
ncbi:MAG TPA: hypothetical protein VFK25_00170 [Candidatus Binatia bacterium]|nr:hypothetical protein [Candidatus Binatia bacterium]